MTTLNAILPGPNTAGPEDAGETSFTSPDKPSPESFDHLMKRTLSSDERAQNPVRQPSQPKKPAGKPLETLKPVGSDANDAKAKTNPVTGGDMTTAGQDADAVTDENAASKSKTKPALESSGQGLVSMLMISVPAPASVPMPVSEKIKPDLSDESSLNASTGSVSGTSTKQTAGMVLSGSLTQELSTTSVVGESTSKSSVEMLNAKLSAPEVLSLNKSVQPDAADATTKPSVKSESKSDVSPELVADADKSVETTLATLPPNILPGKSESSSASPDKVALKPMDQATWPVANATHPVAGKIAEFSDQPQPLEAAGTAVAKQVSVMKNAAQIDKVAGQAEQVLPGHGSFVAEKKILPTVTALKSGVAQVSGLQTGFTTTSGAQAIANDSLGMAEQIVSASSIKAQSATVEHTHNLVALNAIRLQEAGASSLRVVIKPDNGTQLSLELRQRDNGVEAQATLQSGDFAHLNQHWSELQQRLEQRGVRLAALTSEQNFTSTGNGQNPFQQSTRQSGGEESTEMNRAVRFAAPGSTSLSTSTAPGRRVSSRGWETWA